MNINQIEIEHIERLDALQLTKVLHSLLLIELKKNAIIGEAFVPFNINTGDGGDDGRVRWTGGPSSTKWLKNRFCIFQNKATTLSEKECYKEITSSFANKKAKKLKSEIKTLIEANGCYILFTNQNLNSKLKEKRINGFRNAMEDAGHSNSSSIEIKVYDSNSIKDWVNENIATVTLVQSYNNITREGFQTWEEWELILEGTDIPYKTNSQIDQNLKAIVDTIVPKSTLRIIGHSGIGKTRLVLEAFRNKTLDKEIEALKKQLVYYEIGINRELKYLYNYILSHTNQSGILVIDSCDETAHSALSGLIKSISNFSLITIDIGSATNEETSFKIDRNDQRDIVKEIINQLLGMSHRQSDKDYLNNLCEGYPWMAVKFCNSIQKNGIADFSNSLPSDFIKRLLFSGNNENELEYNIIRACSVFSTFGFLDDELRLILNKEHQESLEHQMNFIRTVIYDGDISESKFYKICQKYRREDIIEKRGTQFIVKPTILAINLASDWLLNTPPTRIIAILQKLKGEALSQKFVERLKDLDQLDKAQQIVNELWGPNSPFGSAEVLNTQWGSLLFRYVVEVNPKSTAKALKMAFGKYSKTQILNIKEGRRNLVWALEKLCFRKEAFPTAAKILYSFAVSENETWGNNATNQFKQLFQLYLSGTQANLSEKLKIIDFGLSKNDDDYTKIAIIALGRGIFNHHYTRIGGADKQGSKAPLIDYIPTYDDMSQFWDKSVHILTDLACSNNIHANLAKEKLANAFRTLIRDGQINLVARTVKRVAKSSNQVWLEALNALKMTIRFETINPKVIIQINNLVQLLTPSSVKDQLFYKITKPEWHSFDEDDDGHYIDKQKINAEELARELVQTKVDFLKFLPNLLEGEQRQGFNFGNKLGQLVIEKEEFLNKAISILDTIPLKQRNPELIGGFLFGANDKELKDKILDKIIKTESLKQHAFYITRVINPNLNDLKKLFAIVDGVNISIEYFKGFQYGGTLKNLKPSEIIVLSDKIIAYGKKGRWTALSLLFMYCFNHEEKWAECNSFIQKLISDDNILIGESKMGALEPFHWTKSVEKLLIESPNDDFAITIASQIVNFCANYNYTFTRLKDILKILLDNYFNIVWPIIGGGIIGNPLTYFHLKGLLGKHNGNWGQGGHLFDDNKINKKILEWVRENPKNAPKRIANIMPLGKYASSKIEWHPFSKSIIDEFGHQESVLNELAANMGTYGITGSSVDYYTNQKSLLEILIDHPIDEVNDWAERMLEYTIKRIKQEKLNDDERYL